MEDFEILSRSSKTRAGKPVLEWQKIIEKVGDSVTKFAKDAADQENKTVQLTSLEGANLPTQLLSVWTSRLSTLTTLTIRDGSVLTEEVAASIRDYCPAFRDLTCFNIRGQTVEENMSAFFQTLRPNSLENFAVLSSNEIGYDTLDGLMQHSRSLTSLTLASLQTTCLPFLHLLSKCQYLESLTIESSTPSPPNTWAAGDEDPLIDVSAWLKECKHLRKLAIRDLGGASRLLAEVLKSPDLRLKDLEVKLVDDEVELYSAVRRQTDLESLMFRSTIEVSDPTGLRHDLFLESICFCEKLKDLDMMLIDQIQLTSQDLAEIQACIPELESISFDGECEYCGNLTCSAEVIYDSMFALNLILTVFSSLPAHGRMPARRHKITGSFIINRRSVLTVHSVDRRHLGTIVKNATPDDHQYQRRVRLHL